MFQPDGLSSTRVVWHGRRLAISTLAFCAWLLLAMPAFGQPFGAEPQAAVELLEQLDDDYKILTLSDRYLLQPKDRSTDLRSIEIKAGSVAVNGEDVTRDQLVVWAGDSAEAILTLSGLALAEPPATEPPVTESSETEPLATEPVPTESSAAEELRQRIERLAEERRIRAEEIEDLVRSRVDELESLEREHQEALEETLEEQRRAERERRRDQRHEERERRRGSVRTDTRVSFGSSLKVEENEISRDVVVLGGSLDVEGKVRGDAVVVGGSAEISGEVSGTVTAVGGSISLGPGARIEGDAISIGGAVQRDPSAEIHGEITEVALAPGLDLDDMWDGVTVPHWRFGGFDGPGELFGRIGKSMALGVLLLLMVLIFPRLIAGISNRARHEPWKAGIVGLGTQLLFLFALPVVCFILMLTIVGIPLALLLAPLATFALILFFLFGFAGIARAGGELLKQRFDWHTTSPYLLVLLGLVLIQGWSILGEALGLFGGPIRVLGWLALLLGFLLKYVAWTTGLGATLLHYLSPLPESPASRSVVMPLPAAAGYAGSPPPPPPGPPAPSPAWEDVSVDVETEEFPDPDEEYRQAGTKPEAEEDESVPPVPTTADEVIDEASDTDSEEVDEASDRDSEEAGETPDTDTEETEEPADPDEEYRQAGSKPESSGDPAEDSGKK